MHDLLLYMSLYSKIVRFLFRQGYLRRLKKSHRELERILDFYFHLKRGQIIIKLQHSQRKAMMTIKTLLDVMSTDNIESLLVFLASINLTA